MIRQTVFLAVILVFLVSCRTQIYMADNDFELVEATSQEFLGGVQGAGSGTDYTMLIRKKTDATLEFDTVWMDNRPFDLLVIESGTPVAPQVVREDEVVLNFTYFQVVDPDSERVQEFPQAVPAEAPQFEGEALLIYRVNGERKTFEIPGFKRKQSRALE